MNQMIRVDRNEKLKYKELKRRLFVFLGANYDRAKSYTDYRGSGNEPDAIAGVFEFEIPSDMSRPCMPGFEGGDVLVKKKVNLDYAKQLYVAKSNIMNAAKLLFENDRRLEVKVLK